MILDDLPPLLLVGEVTELLRVSRRTIERYCRAGKLNYVVVGNGSRARVRITRESVWRLVNWRAKLKRRKAPSGRAFDAACSALFPGRERAS